MSYLERLTRTTKSPAADYHLFLLKRPEFHKKRIDPFIQTPLVDIIADIKALEEDIAAFERKYHCSSEQIYQDYMQGKEPEDESFMLDFGEWASIYRIWLRRKDKYEQTLREQVSTLYSLPLAA